MLLLLWFGFIKYYKYFGQPTWLYFSEDSYYWMAFGNEWV